MRDYRKHEYEQGFNSTSSPMAGFPIFKKVRLRVTLENVVKDVSLVSNDSWSYADLMVSIMFTLAYDIKFLLSHGVLMQYQLLATGCRV